MQDDSSKNDLPSRREFIKTTSTAVAGGSLAGILAGCSSTEKKTAVATATVAAATHAHAQADNTIRIGLIGCGGRGTGAAANALSVPNEQVKLVAMADVFDSQIKKSYDALKKDHADKVDVSEDRKFVGFDGYKKVMDCLKPGDVAIFTTPLAFRWVHFQYAIDKGLNVFMEKPLTADGPTSKKMLELGEKSVAKNLKVGVGLMSRHSKSLKELHQRIRDGELGEILLMRGYRMAPGPLATQFSEKWPGTPSELLWQISRFHSFLWLSGGNYSDFYIHHVDHLCWMKEAWPIKAQALGGRHYRYNNVDQNFDSYSVEYTFADGTKMLMDGRNMNGAHSIYSSYAHGTKGMAVVAKHGDCGGPSSIYKGQNILKADQLWESKDNSSPYQNEWNSLIESIRKDRKHNETKRGVYASIATSMGRMAAHTAQEITWDDMLNCPHEFAPGVDQLTMTSAPPLKSNAEGKYPVPEPGTLKDREYQA